MFKGKTLMAPYECRKNGHGYIHDKNFFLWITINAFVKKIYYKPVKDG